MSDNSTWASRGIAWERIPVQQQNGPHATDKVGIGSVWAPRLIPTKEGIDAAVAHFNPARVGSWINGSSSFDVRARSWYKARYNKDRAVAKMSDEAMQEAIYQNVLLTSGRGRIAERETRIVCGPYTRIVRSGEEVSYETLFTDAMAAITRVMPDAPQAFLRDFVAQSLATAGFEPEDATEE